MRSGITKEIKEKSKELLGYEITWVELRLMPYIQYVLENTRKIDRAKINEEEEEIIQKWMDQGWILKRDPLAVTKKFWDAMSELIWLAYVKR